MAAQGHESLPGPLGIAAFVVDGAGLRSVELQSAPRVRGASVLKPLLAWAAATLEPFAGDAAGWARLAHPAITVSDNDATAALWCRAGGERLLTSLNERFGFAWRIEGHGEHPALRVMVTAGELAGAYATLASDRTEAGAQVRRWMREVPTDQTFGVRKVAVDALGVEEHVVRLKCGWFGGERAHAITVVPLGDRTVGAAVTTSWRPDEVTRTAARHASGDDRALVRLHDTLAGRAIGAATRQALVAAMDL